MIDQVEEGTESTEVVDVPAVDVPESIETVDEIVEEVETPEIVETESADHVEGAVAGEVGDVVEEEPESYESEYTYKVLDETFEMDDRLKGYIKNEDDEAYFRDLLERAGGVEPLKQDRQQLRNDNTRLIQTETTRQAAVSNLQEFVKNGDLKPFMDTWGIDDKQLSEYVLQRINLQEMDPAQRAEYERNEQARMQNYALQEQNRNLQMQQDRAQVEQVQRTIDNSIANPAVSSYAKSYDAQKGEGAFRREIASLGNAYFHQNNGQMVHPDRLAQEVIKKLWVGEPPQAQAPEAPRQRANRPTTIIRNRNKPTLPRVRGSGASPVKSFPKSIADLRDLHQRSIGG